MEFRVSVGGRNGGRSGTVPLASAPLGVTLSNRKTGLGTHGPGIAEEVWKNVYVYTRGATPGLLASPDQSRPRGGRRRPARVWGCAPSRLLPLPPRR